MIILFLFLFFFNWTQLYKENKLINKIKEAQWEGREQDMRVTRPHGRRPPNQNPRLVYTVINPVLRNLASLLADFLLARHTISPPQRRGEIA